MNYLQDTLFHQPSAKLLPTASLYLNSRYPTIKQDRKYVLAAVRVWTSSVEIVRFVVALSHHVKKFPMEPLTQSLSHSPKNWGREVLLEGK